MVSRDLGSCASRRIVSRLPALIALLFAVHGSLSADDALVPINPVDVEAGSTLPVEAEKQRRQNTVTVGVLILIGVAAVGLLLISAALIWGSKVRRMVRQPPAEPSRQDDLWYLKNKIEAEEPAADGPDPRAMEPPADGSDADETKS